MEQKTYCTAVRYGMGTPSAYGQMRMTPQSVQRQSMPQPEPDCGCKYDCGSDHIASKQPFMPAMAYVPDHAFDNLLPVETGFCAGTIFSCLNLPFTGKEVR